MTWFPSLRRALRLGTAALVAAGCGDSPAEPGRTPAAEYLVVVNSQDRSLTAVPVDSPEASFTVGLAPDGSPVTVAARGARAVVPLGTVPAAAVVDLVERRVTHTVALPEGSGATGVAFVNDSIALVANPGRNSVSPVNVLRGTRGEEIAVGGYPQAVVAAGDTAFVLNSELGPDFAPTGPGSISVVAGSPLRVVAAIELSGMNPGHAAAGSDGRLYVVHSGSFGAGDGSLSIVDRRTLAETGHATGFGDFPGSVAIGPAGRLYIASFSYGIAVWDPGAGAFIRGPADAVRPGGIGSTSGVGFDSAGRLYALEPECREPGRIFRLGADFAVEREIPAGTCPFGIAFTTVPEGGA